MTPRLSIDTDQDPHMAEYDGQEVDVIQRCGSAIAVEGNGELLLVGENELVTGSGEGRA